MPAPANVSGHGRAVVRCQMATTRTGIIEPFPFFNSYIHVTLLPMIGPPVTFSVSFRVRCNYLDGR